MHKFLYFLGIILSVFSCDYTPKPVRSIEDLVPKNASIVLHINSLEGFQSAVENNHLISKTGAFNSLKKVLTPLDSLKSLSPLLVCINKEAASQAFTFITHQKKSNFNGYTFNSSHNSRQYFGGFNVCCNSRVFEDAIDF